VEAKGLCLGVVGPCATIGGSGAWVLGSLVGNQEHTMTTDKARKRAVRTRMTKTGERYAAARRHLVTDDHPASPTALPPRVAEPGMTDAAITKGTGQRWDDWFRVLDDWGAATKPHPEVARYVNAEHGIDGWWAQAVTVGYERARGLRAVHQTTSGFEVSVSKTVAAPPAEVWSAFVEARRRERWLEPGLLRNRPNSGSVGRSARFEVAADGTRVGIWIEPRGDDRATVTVTHERLAGAADVATKRAAWKERLERLAALWADRSAAKRRAGAS
jgi:hypothetical protein